MQSHGMANSWLRESQERMIVVWAPLGPKEIMVQSSEPQFAPHKFLFTDLVMLMLNISFGIPFKPTTNQSNYPSKGLTNQQDHSTKGPPNPPTIQPSSEPTNQPTSRSKFHHCQPLTIQPTDPNLNSFHQTEAP